MKLYNEVVCGMFVYCLKDKLAREIKMRPKYKNHNIPNGFRVQLYASIEKSLIPQARVESQMMLLEESQT